MSFLLKEKMIDFYWKTKRSYWRSKSKLKQVKFFFKRIFSRVENFFIATYWKLYKRYRHLYSILHWLYWKLHKIGGFVYSILNSLYWKIHKKGSLVYSKLNVAYWKLRKNAGFFYSKLNAVYWKFRKKVGFFSSKVNSLYWKIHSSIGALMVVFTNIYWKIRRFFSSLRIGFIKFSLSVFFQTRGLLRKSGTSLYWSFFSVYSSIISISKQLYWGFRKSFLWAPFNKVYWFLKFQYQKRFVKKNN